MANPQSKWIAVSDAGVSEWNGLSELSFKNIKESMENTFILHSHDYWKDGNYQPSYKKLWYSESRDFLLSCGIQPLNDVARSGEDACPHESLHGSELWCKSKYTGFAIEYITIPPVLLTRIPLPNEDESTTGSQKYEITLWAINTIKTLHIYRGAYIKRPETITIVRPMYRGILTDNKLSYFLDGIQPIIPEEYRLVPPPSESDIKKQIIELKLKEWIIHNCSLCNYPCGYKFSISRDEVSVYYDCGCNCSSSGWRKESLAKILDHINMQTNKEVLIKYSTFWNLESDVVKR